jgi:hypothetical protein
MNMSSSDKLNSADKRQILAEKNIIQNESNNVSLRGSPYNEATNISGLSLISDKGNISLKDNSYNFTLSDNKKDIADLFRKDKPRSRSPTNYISHLADEKHNNRYIHAVENPVYSVKRSSEVSSKTSLNQEHKFTLGQLMNPCRNSDQRYSPNSNQNVKISSSEDK